MTRPVIQLVSAWLLLWAYIASAAASPLGVLLCRDASGATHVEWKFDGVLCEVDDGTGLDLERRAPEVSPCEDSRCDAGACVDEPLSTGDRIVASQHELRFELGLGVGAGAPAIVSADPGPNGWVVRRALWMTGPPRQVTCCVSTTVLRL